MRQVAVLDIDGVIADARHRLHLIGLSDHGIALKESEARTRDWDAFYAAVSQDEILATGWDLAWSLAKRCEIVYLTGRRESTRADTESWLWERRHPLPPGQLLMRPDGDYRPGAELKLEMLGQHFIGRTVVLVVDDDPKVCDAFQQAGHTVLQACWARAEEA